MLARAMPVEELRRVMGTDPWTTETDLFVSRPTASPRRTVEFRTVFEGYRSFVIARLRKLGVPRADINDVGQEVFVIIHRRLHTYDESVPLPSWVEGICDRAATRFRRMTRVRREMACGLPALEMVRSVPAYQDRAVDTRRACAHAEALLNCLDEEKRKVFVLYELEGLNMNEVVDALGCPLQTGYSRLHAARKTIRTLLLRSRLGRPSPGTSQRRNRSE
jgi:RNA polymerase sigma-70 factor (ECF subfamily)